MQARGSDLRVHFKNTREAAAAIRGLSLTKAKSYLEAVVDHKRCIPFLRYNGAPHRPQGVGVGGREARPGGAGRGGPRVGRRAPGCRRRRAEPQSTERGRGRGASTDASQEQLQNNLS